MRIIYFLVLEIIFLEKENFQAKSLTTTVSHIGECSVEVDCSKDVMKM